MRKHFPIISAGFVLTALRLYFASNLPLSPDETYYFTWSKDLLWTYPDHPPLVAWMMRSGTLLFGETRLGIRFFNVISGTLSLFTVYILLVAYGISRNKAFWGALLSTIIPSVAVGNIIATPDGPMGFFWLLSFGAIYLLTKTKKRKFFYLLGFALALGLLSKHTAFLIIPGLIFVAIRTRTFFSLAKSADLWLALILVVFICAPAYYFDFLNGNSAFAFQSGHLAGKFDPLPNQSFFLNMLEIAGGQIGLLSPVAAGIAFVWCFKKFKYAKDAAFIAGFVLPLAATLAASFFVHPEQNWAALGHPFAAIGVTIFLNRLSKRELLFFTSFGSALLCSLVIHIHAVKPFLAINPLKDPVSKLHGWDEVKKIKEIIKITKVQTVVSDNYGLASSLAWHIKNKDVSFLSCDRPERKTDNLKPGTWLLADELGDWSQKSVRTDCKKIKKIESIGQKYCGEIIRTIVIEIGENCTAIIQSKR